jgi:hypothetical protein
MGSFGWGDLIAVVAVLVSLASVVVTVRTARGAEAAAMAAAKRQEHMARSFDELVTAARRIADASEAHHGTGARAGGAPGPRWHVENPSAGHFLLRNLSPSTRHDVRISFAPGSADGLEQSGGGDRPQQSGGVDLPPLAARSFEIRQDSGGGNPQRVLVTDAEHPEPIEVSLERWF